MASAICLGWESCAPWPRLKGAAVLTPLPRRSGATRFLPRWLTVRQAAKTSRRGPEAHAGKTKRPRSPSRGMIRTTRAHPGEGSGAPRRGDVARGRSQTCKREKLPTLVAKLSFPPPHRRVPFTLLIEAVRTNFRQERIIRFFSTLCDVPLFFSKINPAAKSFAGRPKGEHEDGERFRRHGLRG
jgi:hypothetical protein